MFTQDEKWEALNSIHISNENPSGLLKQDARISAERQTRPGKVDVYVRLRQQGKSPPKK